MLKQGNDVTADQVKIVGICAAGKTTLERCLRRHGFRARQIAQEHANVPDLWQRFHPAEITVYLDASDATALQRRPSPLLEPILPLERKRLRHARAGADFYLLTDHLSPEQVCAHVRAFLASRALAPDSVGTVNNVS